MSPEIGPQLFESPCRQTGGQSENIATASPGRRKRNDRTLSHCGSSKSNFADWTERWKKTALTIYRASAVE